MSPADRAFGAQRSSGGRTGRRFAPPSAAGSASRCYGAPSAPQWDRLQKHFGCLVVGMSKSELRGSFLSICCHEQLGSNISFESSFGSYWHILAYICPYYAIWGHIGPYWFTLEHIAILDHIGQYGTILIILNYIIVYFGGQALGSRP